MRSSEKAVRLLWWLVAIVGAVHVPVGVGFVVHAMAAGSVTDNDLWTAATSAGLGLLGLIAGLAALWRRVARDILSALFGHQR